jgi:hypothetical protein
MGKSGARLDLAVRKSGKGAGEQGNFCRILGSTVAPRIYQWDAHGYCMEYLTPLPELTVDLPITIEAILESRVWSRPPEYGHGSWIENLHNTTWIIVPPWAHQTQPCLTHGDPTIANVMLRDDTSNRIVLCDPVPPGHRVPQIREIDQAKIIQSMLGWEAMIGGRVLGKGWDNWITPKFLMRSSQDDVWRQAFWTGVTMRRCIDHLRNNLDDLDTMVWCHHIWKETFRAVGL